MNREIKFRAWDSKNKIMVDSSYGNWISFDGVLYEESNIKYNTPHVEIEKSKDLILMQYTNRKDVNGTEVCDGDIIENYDTKELQVVYWNEKWASWFCRYINDKTRIVSLSESLGNLNTVIGNLYQNPELLKGGSDAK